MKTTPRTTAIIAVVCGFALWFMASVLTRRREPWDSGTYWTVAYPLALVACAALGYLCSDRPWRWALVLFESQFVAMCVRNGEIGSLWPLGLMMFAVIALPGIAAAHLAAKVRGEGQ